MTTLPPTALLTLRQRLHVDDGTDAIDLRLVCAALCAWGALLVFISRCWQLTLLVAGVCALTALVMLLAMWRALVHRALARFMPRRWLPAIYSPPHSPPSRRLTQTALTAGCLIMVLAPLSARQHVLAVSPLRPLVQRHTYVTASIVVKTDPRLLVSSDATGASKVVFDAEITAARTAEQVVTLAAPIVVFAPAATWTDLLPGQQVRLGGIVQPAQDDPLTAAMLSAISAPILVGKPPWWQRAGGTVRATLREAVRQLPEPVRGLLPGVIDGDTTDLDPVLAQHMREAGLTHLVAVSGTNCSILVIAVLLAGRWLRLGPLARALAAGLVVLAFVVVARPSPSVLRAAVMAIIALLALATGRPRAALPALAATVMLLLVYDPRLATDVGFAMSVAATAALLLIAPRWSRALTRHRWLPSLFAETFAVAAAAHLVTAPLVASFSGRISMVAIPANMLAEPVVVPVTVLGFLTAVIAPLWLGGAQPLAWLASWPCRWLVWVGDFFGQLKGATLAWPTGAVGACTLCAVIALAGWITRRRNARRLLAVSVISARRLCRLVCRLVGWRVQCQGVLRD